MDAQAAMDLLQVATGVQAKYRIVHDQPALVAQSFALSMALGPDDIVDALAAQFALRAPPEGANVPCATLSSVGDFTHGVAEAGERDAKLTQRSMAFTFVLDDESLREKEAPVQVCCGCSAPAPEAVVCAGCGVTAYCGAECARADWEGRHGRICQLKAAARTGADAAAAEEAPGTTPLVDRPTTGDLLARFREAALSTASDLAIFAMLQTARFSSRVVLFVDVSSYESEALLAAARAVQEEDIAEARAAGKAAGGEPEEVLPPAVVVRRLAVTAVPVYQLLLMDPATGSKGAFAHGGRVRRLVGDVPIVPGERDDRACREGATLALPRAAHVTALESAHVAVAIQACTTGTVPHPRFPATPQGRQAAFQAGDTLVLVLRDADSGFAASAVFQPAIPSASLETAIKRARGADEAGFQALAGADVLYVEQLASAPGPPNQHMLVTAGWREEARGEAGEEAMYLREF